MALNLCETVDEDPCFAGHPAALFELLDIPFSGSPAVALMLTTDKLTTKQLLKAHGIMTPPYRMYDGTHNLDFRGLKYPVILKPRFQDASIGIEQESIFIDNLTLREGINGFFDRFGPLLVPLCLALGACGLRNPAPDPAAGAMAGMVTVPPALFGVTQVSPLTNCPHGYSESKVQVMPH